MNGEGIAVTAPIGEAGAVTEDEAGGDFRKAWVALDVGFWEIGSQGNIQAEFALLNQFQNGIGKDGFAEGGSLEDSVVVHGLAGFLVFNAKVLLPRDFSAADEGYRKAGDIAFFHQF